MDGDTPELLAEVDRDTTELSAEGDGEKLAIPWETGTECSVAAKDSTPGVDTCLDLNLRMIAIFDGSLPGTEVVNESQSKGEKTKRFK